MEMETLKSEDSRYRESVSGKIAVLDRGFSGLPTSESPGGLVRNSVVGLPPWSSDSLGQKMNISNTFPSDADVPGRNYFMGITVPDAPVT